MNTLQEILKIDAEISSLGVKHGKLKYRYLKENCPYKVGQKIRMKPKYGQEENGIISSIQFSLHHPFIKGMARLNVQPLTNDWKPKLRRAYVNLEEDSEIIKVIE